MMDVRVRGKNQHTGSRGQPAYCPADGFSVKADGDWLSITATGNSERGSGQKLECYDKEAVIHLTRDDLTRIITAAVDQKLISLDSPDKARVEKVRKHLDEAMEALNERVHASENPVHVPCQMGRQKLRPMPDSLRSTSKSRANELCGSNPVLVEDLADVGIETPLDESDVEIEYPL